MPRRETDNVLVSLGCHIKNNRTCVAYNNKHVFSNVLEAQNPRYGVGRFGGRASSQKAVFLLSPYMIEGASSLGSLLQEVSFCNLFHECFTLVT